MATLAFNELRQCSICILPEIISKPSGYMIFSGSIGNTTHLKWIKESRARKNYVGRAATFSIILKLLRDLLDNILAYDLIIQLGEKQRTKPVIH